MRRTKLILIEGLPGSGKSTLAQFLARTLTRQGVFARWWYEEEVGHPVYIFHDREELRSTVERLQQGDYQQVIQEALEFWRCFAHTTSQRDDVVLVDSCLFGYLTWSLFPLDVPVDQIEAYVVAVEELVAPLDPCLIYLHQDDIGASLRRICARRGASTEQRLLEQSTRSPYGRRRSLNGFDGMVDYWSAYGRLTDGMFEACSFAKVAIETTAGDWVACQRQSIHFLSLNQPNQEPHALELPARFSGRYEFTARGITGFVHVRLAKGCLILDGMPEVWRETPLIPIAPDCFQVESMPFEVRFVVGQAGDVTHMVVSGPEVIGGPIPRALVRCAVNE